MDQSCQKPRAVSIARASGFHHRNIISSAIKSAIPCTEKTARRSQLNYNMPDAAVQKESGNLPRVFKAADQHSLIYTGKEIIQIWITGADDRIPSARKIIRDIHRCHHSSFLSSLKQFGCPLAIESRQVKCTAHLQDPAKRQKGTIHVRCRKFQTGPAIVKERTLSLLLDENIYLRVRALGPYHVGNIYACVFQLLKYEFSANISPDSPYITNLVAQFGQIHRIVQGIAAGLDRNSFYWAALIRKRAFRHRSGDDIDRRFA